MSFVWMKSSKHIVICGGWWKASKYIDVLLWFYSWWDWCRAWGRADAHDASLRLWDNWALWQMGNFVRKKTSVCGFWDKNNCRVCSRCVSSERGVRWVDVSIRLESNFGFWLIRLIYEFFFSNYLIRFSYYLIILSDLSNKIIVVYRYQSILCSNSGFQWCSNYLIILLDDFFFIY